ncbi:MAG TPA: ABC transporter permease [Vicinamibacterales bacterium]|nr:ABC transporter permease [Vicinamibacterales bacterium]
MLCLRGDAREVIIGDLDEEFAESLAAGTPIGSARRHYWRQTLASVMAMGGGAREDRATTRRRFHPWLGLSLDGRSVMRVLRRSPGYVAVSVLSLAIGIGANTAIFSVVRQLLLEPLPVDRPDELRLLYWTTNANDPVPINNLNSTGYRDPAGAYYRSNFNYAEVAAMRAAVRGSADLCGYNVGARLTVSREGRPPIAATGMLVSGNFFETLRPGLALGRALTAADDEPGAAPAGVIGYGLWTRLFGRDPGAIGQTIQVNGAALTIVGVTDASFRGLSPGGFAAETDVILTLAQQPAIVPNWAEPGHSLFTETNPYWVRAIARVPGTPNPALIDRLRTVLREGLARTGLTAEQARLADARLFPGARGLDSLRTTAIQPLRILSVVVGIVLLIACVNVAGLMLARGVSRRRELLVRQALGAGRGRIVRELLLESTLLSVAGGVAGLVLAVWSAPALQSMLASGLGTNGISVKLDWPLFAVAAALAGGAGVLAGLLPAIRFSRDDSGLLKDRTAGAGSPRLLMGRVLLALQIAVSLPLVAGAGLFLRTLHNLGSVELGFNPRGLVLFTVDPTMSGKAPDRAAAIFPRLLERLETIPGVSSATLVENALLSGWESDTTVAIDGKAGHMFMNAVGPHYLETMQVPLIAGRPIGPEDRLGLPNVVVVNQTAARRYFGDESPLGRRFKVGMREVEVVGVTGDSKYDGLRNDIEPTMLQSYLQRQMGSMHVVVRASAPLGSLRPEIERAVADVDRTLPITDYKTQDEQIDQSLGKERVFARLLTVFGAFALVLACIGLHGVTSYSVARRTSEIGIRLALGAQRAHVLWLVLQQVVVLAAIGLAIGLPAAWLAGPAVKSFLFGLGPNDPMTIVVSSAVMTAVAMGAGLWPARRAARMEALDALRSE